MIRIRSVKPLDNFRIQLFLTNGKRKTIDLDPFLKGPIFEPLRRSRRLFRTVHVDQELGTIVWENGADIDPDVLINDRVPAWFEEQPTKNLTEHNQHSVVRESQNHYKAKIRKRNK
jgi:hypothetical protein